MGIKSMHLPAVGVDSSGSKEIVRVYRILSCLETTFDTFASVIHFCNEKAVVVSIVPRTAAEGEDKCTARICVARSLADCITAIGVHGVFRRCCSAVDGLPSYATLGREVYPIVIMAFDVESSELYEPTDEQVPDVDITGELWLTKPYVPSMCDIVWLNMFSLDVSSVTCKGPTFLYVKHVKLLSMFDVLSGDYDHPWLNRKGHILDSSAMENEVTDWQVSTINDHLLNGDIYRWDL